MLEDKIYFMFNKPRGYITARRDDKHATIMEFFPEELREIIFPVGRLDKDTEGLLLLTNDGQLDQQLMHPVNHVSKTYILYAFGTLTDEQIELIENGLMLTGEEKITKPASLEILDTMTYGDVKDQIILDKRIRENPYNYARPVFKAMLTIREGRKHQVKRMMLNQGCRVISLERLAVGPLVLDEMLARGEYRELTENELMELKQTGTA